MSFYIIAHDQRVIAHDRSVILNLFQDPLEYALSPLRKEKRRKKEEILKQVQDDALIIISALLEDSLAF